MNVHSELTANTLSFHGWDAVRIANRFVQLVAVPAIGGRVMAYDLGGHAFFFVDPELAGQLFSPEENQGDGSLAAWKNYGGDKTWPAPQGWDTDEQWHGPPDPVLDTGCYRLAGLVVEDTRATLSMVSPPDPRTGIEITRSFALGPAGSRVQVELSFRNIGPRTVRWSIWDVVQLAAAIELPGGERCHDGSCCVTAPINPHSRFERGFNVMFGAPDNSQWQVRDSLLWAEYHWQIGKIGLDSTAGWVAFHQGSRSRAFVERFAYTPGGEYPDGGATLECWTVGAGQVANLDYAESGIYLMETEVLSPLYTIAPGKTAGFTLEWASCACNGPVVDVQAGGCSSRRLAVTRVDGSIHVAGSLGVFDAGELRTAWRHDGGELEWRESLGQVDPLQPVVLDYSSTAPPPHAELELYVIAEGDGRARLLARNKSTHSESEEL
jgi:hypothetical protein